MPLRLITIIAPLCRTVANLVDKQRCRAKFARRQLALDHYDLKYDGTVFLLTIFQFDDRFGDSL